MPPNDLDQLSDRAIAQEAVQRGLLDPWRVDNILENDVVPELQRIRELLAGRGTPAPGGDRAGIIGPELLDDLPLGLAGTTIEPITEGKEGDATFELAGTRFVAPVKITRDVAQFEPIEIIADGNVARPNTALTGERADLLAISAADYDQDITLSNVSIAAGDEATVLETDLDEAGLLWAVGANDLTFSRYQYEDGEGEMLTDPAFAPLGLYDSPFEFPHPIIIRDFFRTVVSRDSDASGSAEYFAKHRYTAISTDTANRLENTWEENIEAPT